MKHLRATLFIPLILLLSNGCVLQKETASQQGNRVLFSEDFTQPDLDPETWYLEGTGTATIVDGKLHLKETPDGVGAVLWLKPDWPDSFHLTFEVAFSNNKGIGVFFFSAIGSDGTDALKPAQARTGAYDEYIRGALNTYSLSLHRYWPDGRNNPGSNLRRNSGFHLLDQALPDPCLDANRTYTVEIKKSGPSISVFIDGSLTHVGTDPGEWGSPLKEGKIGFRVRGDPSCRMILDSIRIDHFE
jgi:hypothetical protein